MPKVSIIVPVYNSERYIARCVESVLNQDFTDWELILIDDNSTDKSVSIIKSYGVNDSRIKVIESESNRGPMVAREKGYLASKGDYITFLDSDDSLPPDSLSMLYTGNKIKFKENTPYGLFSKKDILPFLLNGAFPHNLCAKLFKSELFKHGNLKNEKGYVNGEDGLLFYQLLNKVNSLFVINRTVYFYWMNSTSSTHVLKVSDTMIRGMIAQDKYKYDFFRKEAPELDKQLKANIYISISYLSRLCPLNKLIALYEEQNLHFDLNLLSMSKVFDGMELLKTYLKIHFNYPIYRFRKIVKGRYC